MHLKFIDWVAAAFMLLFITTQPHTAAENSKNDNVVMDGMLVNIGSVKERVHGVAATDPLAAPAL